VNPEYDGGSPLCVETEEPADISDEDENFGAAISEVEVGYAGGSPSELLKVEEMLDTPVEDP
jgi:hypothetical protein